jgi:hypothetical protein
VLSWKTYNTHLVGTKVVLGGMIIWEGTIGTPTMKNMGRPIIMNIGFIRSRVLTFPVLFLSHVSQVVPHLELFAL